MKALEAKNLVVGKTYLTTVMWVDEFEPLYQKDERLELGIGKMYVVRGPKLFSFFLFCSEQANKVLGEVLCHQPFVLLAFHQNDGTFHQNDGTSWGDYSLKILTQDGKLGWMVVTEQYMEYIQPA